MRLIAVTEVYYASRTRNPGDPFEASEQDARILVGLGKAVAPVVDAPPPPQPAKASEPAPAAVVAHDDASPSNEQAEKEAPKKRTYKRRDLTAED
jgi:hypothetical protein